MENDDNVSVADSVHEPQPQDVAAADDFLTTTADNDMGLDDLIAEMENEADGVAADMPAEVDEPAPVEEDFDQLAQELLSEEPTPAPMPEPISASFMPCRTNMRTIVDLSAPSACLTPISRRREATA